MSLKKPSFRIFTTLSVVVALVSVRAAIARPELQVVSAPATYTIMDLGDLGAPAGSSAAWGINNQSQVSGFSDPNIPGCAGKHAFRTAANQPINPETDDLGTLEPGCYSSEAYRINDAGEVVGNLTPLIPRIHRAFIYSEGQMRDLPSLHPSGRLTKAYGINNRGQVVGFSRPSRRQ